MSPCRTLQCLQAGAFQPRARQQQHVERQVDAEPALDRGAEQFQHPPGAGAEIEQRLERLAGKRCDDRLFHRLVGGMQLAEAVPFRGMGAEIVLRGLGARFAHGGQSFAIARHHRIGGIEPLDQKARDARAVAAVGHAEERPGALAMALDQAGFGRAA